METWGDKPKSQIDSSTVDDEIDLKIQDHLDDPDAHIESGQSLQSHKASAIIDHVVGSVLADKFTMTEINASTIFESLDGLTITGTVTNDIYPGARCYVEYGYVVDSHVITEPQIPTNFLSDQVDMLYQILLRFEMSNSHFYSWFGFVYGYANDEVGFGFQIRDGVLYAHVLHNGTLADYEISGISLENDNLFRVQFNATTKTVDFYINGSLVYSTVIDAVESWADPFGPAFGLKVTQSNDGYMFIGLLNFSRQIT